MINAKFYWLPVVLSLFFISCDDDKTEELTRPSEAILKTISFNKIDNANLDQNYLAVINQSTKEATFLLPYGTILTKLTASFSVTEGATVKIEDVLQTTGITANNFNSSVIYSIYNGSLKQDYRVIVNTQNSPVFVETSKEKDQRIKIKSTYNKLMAFYDGKNNNVVNGDHNQFSTMPGFTVDGNTGKRTYTIGQYKPQFKQYMLSWWSFYKAIAQRPDPYLEDKDNQISELGALILSSNRQISHSPSKPQDMDEDLYQLGKTGCAQGNLFAAASKYWFHETVQFNFTEGKTKDDGAVSIPSIGSMGHRWNGLWKKATSAGFGYNYFNNYTTAVYRVVYNKNTNGGFQDFSAFPHGYYPVQAELKVKNQLTGEGLFDKRYPQGAKDDINRTSNSATGYHCIWTIQQISNYIINQGKPIKVTIRDVNERGAILDEISCNAGQEINNANGAFLRIKQTAFAGGWTFTIKPKHGIIANAFKEVLNSNQEKVFHITISGPGISPKEEIGSDLNYRIIYYDIDTYQ